MLYVILGPTSSGKSDYAIELAKKMDGEVISADSRQVYRGMDIGTGKVPRDPARITNDEPARSDTRSVSGRSRMTKKYTSEEESGASDPLSQFAIRNSQFFSDGIRHWLLDVASPKRDYNVTHFLRDAKKAIADIEKRGKTPIVCGGTAFWVEALLLGTSFPEVKPDKKLRERLENLSADELFVMIEEKDPDRAASIDPKNKVRLIRALEIIETLGKVPPIKGSSTFFAKKRYLTPSKTRIIVLNPSKDILHARIEGRLKERLDQGMIDEVRRLHDEGVSWKRLEEFGLEYRWCARFLQGKISHENMEVELLKDSKRYAKRQLTFLRRLEREGFPIEWVTKVSS